MSRKVYVFHETLFLTCLIVYAYAFIANACTGPQKKLQIGPRESVYVNDELWYNIPTINSWYGTVQEPQQDISRQFFIDASLATLKINGTMTFMNASYLGIDKYDASNLLDPLSELGAGWHQPWDSVWYASCLTRITDTLQALAPPYNRPITDKLRYYIAANSNYRFIDQPWIPNVYRVRNNSCSPAAAGDLLGFVHVETNVDRYNGNFSYGLAYSKDNGDHWVYCGDIVRPACNASVSSDCNISGLPYLVVRDQSVSYFYVYFNEYPDPDWMKYNSNPDWNKKRESVARAKVSDVLSAAARIFNERTCSGCPIDSVPPPPANPTKLPFFLKFIGDPSDKTKYAWDTASALSPGPGHAGSNIITTIRHGDLHADAAFCKPLNKYLLTVSNGTSSNIRDTGELFLFSSTDGINWKDPVLLDRTVDTTGDANGRPNNYIEKPHSFFVDAITSDDCDSVGSNFFIYTTYSWWPAVPNQFYFKQHLWRRRVTISDATPIAQINFGGNCVGAFVSDNNYVTGGNINCRNNCIDMNAVTDPAPEGVYQSERWGEFTCTISGNLQSGQKMVADSQYMVRLHFVEPAFCDIGKRQFNVFVNNKRVLTNFDIFANAGTQFKALIKEFITTADSAADGSGRIVVKFVNGAADCPSCEGVEILNPPSAVAGGNDTVITSISINPPLLSLAAGSSQKFKATAYNRRGDPVIGQIKFNWTVCGGGTINSDGIFSAGNTASGPNVVSASGATANVSVVDASVSRPALYRVNCGGSTAGEYTADKCFSGGNTNNWNNAIDFSLVPGDHAPAAVYQTERWGVFSYALPGLTPDSNYSVRLHFVEPYFTGAGQRQFNVSINGTLWLSNFDIFSVTNNKFRAFIKDTVITATNSGKIIISFQQGSHDNPTCEGIEVRPVFGTTPVSIAIVPSCTTSSVANGTTNVQFSAIAYDGNGCLLQPQPSPTFWRLDDIYAVDTIQSFGVQPGQTFSVNLDAPYHSVTAYPDASWPTSFSCPAGRVTLAAYQIACGNNAVGTFIPTTTSMCTGGNLNTRSNTINVLNVTNPAPQDVYRTERWGEYTYTLSRATIGFPPLPVSPGMDTLIPGYGYRIRLHFVEPNFSRAGQRQFHVISNGDTALKNFDIFHQAGGQFKAVVKNFIAAADSFGVITLKFARGAADYPSCEGMEVISEQPPTIIVSPATVSVNSITQLTATAYDGAGYAIAAHQATFAYQLFDINYPCSISPTGNFSSGIVSGIYRIIVTGTIYGSTVVTNNQVFIVVQ